MGRKMDNKLLKNQRISVIKKVILIAVLSLIIGMIFTNDLDPVNIERGGAGRTLSNKQ
jgi:hypothetical protein